MTQLFHFSDDANIVSFSPRSVKVPSRRAPGQAWLNGPLVWAIDDWHQFMYLFPRDCPRILLWPTATTNESDRQRFFSDPAWQKLALIESDWLKPLQTTHLYRYEFATKHFLSLNDAGMYIAKQTITPINQIKIQQLDQHLITHRVKLKLVDRLLDHQDLIDTSLHYSGIRLRYAKR